MFKFNKLTLATVTFLIIIFGINETAKADPVTVTLENPLVAGPLGSTFTFYGTVTNAGPPTARLFLDDVFLSGGEPLGTSFHPLFDDVTLTAGQSTGIVPLLTFTLGADYAGLFPATQTATFSLVKQVSPSTFAGLADFTVTIVATGPAPAPVPEPVSVALLGTGLAFLGAKLRRSRKG